MDTATPGYFYVPELRVFVHDLYADLVKEIQAELGDPTFKRYRHGRCSTNNRGCSGPMCRKARRDWRAANARTRAQMKGRAYNPRVSAEKIMTDELFSLYEDWVEIQWVHQTTRQEIEQVLAKRPLENLQTSECAQLRRAAASSYCDVEMLIPELI